MASSLKRLATGQLPNASASLYAPGGNRCQVVNATLSNPTAGAVTFGFYVVPSGSSAVAATVLYPTTSSIAAGDVITLDKVIGHALNAGDALHGVASAATSLTYHFSGVEFSTG